MEKTRVEILKDAGAIILALLALMVLVAGTVAIYLSRGRKLEKLDIQAEEARLRVKEAEKRGDGAAIKEEILRRVKEARRGGK